MEHLSADRLADIISTDRAAAPESAQDVLDPESATMSHSYPTEYVLVSEQSGPADPFVHGARPSVPAAEVLHGQGLYDEGLYDAGLYDAGLNDRELYDEELNDQDLVVEVLALEDLAEEEPEMAPVFSGPPVLAAPPVSPSVSRRAQKGGRVGRHRRPRSLKHKVRTLSLTSVLLTMMGVLTLIVVATAVHAAS